MESLNRNNTLFILPMERRDIQDALSSNSSTQYNKSILALCLRKKILETVELIDYFKKFESLKEVKFVLDVDNKFLDICLMNPKDKRLNYVPDVVKCYSLNINKIMKLKTQKARLVLFSKLFIYAQIVALQETLLLKQIIVPVSGVLINTDLGIHLEV
tara:strand:+ start:1239 stop:1712 length:474 start_codon:yes stop_codon:yes gene_type:complete